MDTEEFNMDFETWFEVEFSNNRYNFEQELMEHWYSSHFVSEIDDWWDEFLKKEYDLYITNLT